MDSKPDLPDVSVITVKRDLVQAVRRTVTAREDKGRWLSMTKPEREALVALVSDGLERLARHPEEWLPDNLVVQPDGRIGMFILWQFAEVDAEIVARRQRATEREEQRIAALTEMARQDGTQSASG